MKRPRWHDALIVTAIVGIALAGTWAFWGQELARSLGLASEQPPAPTPTPTFQ